MDIRQLITKRRSLVKDICDYSISQKNLWRRVPYLALEADGRTGFGDNYSRAYNGGFWALDGSIVNGGYEVYVHLTTGNLVDAYFASNSLSVSGVDIRKESKLKRAKDSSILGLDLDELDAQKNKKN